MKATQKMALLPILILFLTAVFAYAQPPQPAEPPPEPPVAPPPAPLESPGFTFDEDYIAGLLDQVKQNDPNEAQRLENLRQENPGLFQVEIRKLARAQKEQQRGPESERFRHRTAMQDQENQMMFPRGRDRGRDRNQAMEAELISWLEKNEPEKAKELAALKEKDPPAYMRRLSLEMKKYRQIIETERTNPALAELLKKDLGLKEKRNELLEKLKGTTDEKQKTELTAQLKEVIGERFDVILQKKQLKYEELKKKLEELQQSVKKSQAELENFKNKKEEHIKKYMESLINQAEQFDWD